jgi:hypothetical protein
MPNSGFCRTERRRYQVRKSEDLNGLDYIEVLEDGSLRVFFLKRPPQNLTPDNIRIEGGVRVTGIKAVKIRFCRQLHDDRDDCMQVFVERTGDFSTYRLCLVEPCQDAGGKKTKPLSGFDVRYSCASFRFCSENASDLDCKQTSVCLPPARTEPEINYLAKDYGSFRRLMLDRLAVLMPDWQERHEADLQVALVEVLAYFGDRLSYYQDAVATEAYLGTARQRISVRRHVRLVDYHMHEGCNARTFVQVRTNMDHVKLALADFVVATRLSDPGLSQRAVMTWTELENIAAASYEVFQPVVLSDAVVTFWQSHNEIRFYTWGDRECCLPRGATSATLIDPAPAVPVPIPAVPAPVVSAAARYATPAEHCEPEPPALPPCQEPERGELGLHLKVGDILIFEEVMGPLTGLPQDADPGHRHAVRLTRVRRGTDKLYNQPIVDIEWSREDALPFPLCLSSRTDSEHGCKPLPFVSVALGNIVLVDHGRPASETLPLPGTETEVCGCAGDFRPADPVLRIKPYDPQLAYGPLTWTGPLAAGASATALRQQDPRTARPVVALGGDGPVWQPRYDLLGSGPTDRHFVVETDNAEIAHLRFGDGTQGAQPPAGVRLPAHYRVGNGPAGNIGGSLKPDTQGPGIAHMIFSSTQGGLDVRVWNPLPAIGGTAPEDIDDVKRCAPRTFRDRLERAITADDYAALAQQSSDIQRAASLLAWNGSWYEAEVALDPLSRLSTGEQAALPSRIETGLEVYRRIGHDLRAYLADAVPLNLVMSVCVQPAFLPGPVKAAVLAKLREWFQPDNLTFGQDIAISPLVALVKNLDGVFDVTVTTLERKFQPSDAALASGILRMAPWEIARLDNDPNRPENGTLKLTMRGGR